METKVIIQTGNANCHDFREDCMKAIQKHFDNVSFDQVWQPFGEQFVLDFTEGTEADFFVLDFTADMGFTFRLSKCQYSSPELKESVPGLWIEIISA